MHRNKEDFFEQMDNYKTSYSKFEILCGGITIASLIIDYILLILIACEVLKFNVITTLIIIVLACLFVLAFIYLLMSLFSKNKALFIAGKLSAGIKNFAIIVVPLYITLLIFYLTIPQWREFLPSIFTISTTMAVAILTIMGVHYNIAKQQIEKNNRKNLIFALSEEETANNFNIRNSLGNQTIQLKLKNISDNFGYFIGLYRICGCDAHQIGDELPYFPIKPQTTYSLSNIKLNFGDDQLIIVYTDISNNFYYLLISSNYQYIESAGKCDMDFLNWRLDMTEKSEQKSNNKLIKQKSTGHITDEDFIIRRKEETKPNNTIRENGFDLIISPDGSISTDINLLNKLKKERIRIAKEQKIKAYMVFNNQQLVAMATYKPHDELSFISIYGLGKKKFELYGELLLPIIAKHNSDTH